MHYGKNEIIVFMWLVQNRLITANTTNDKTNTTPISNATWSTIGTYSADKTEVMFMDSKDKSINESGRLFILPYNTNNILMKRL